MVDKRWLLSRRALLGSLAVAGVSPLLGGGRAHAASTAPKRFIVVHVPEGMWGGAPRPTPDALGPIMEPLAPFRDRVLVCNNLNMKSRDFGPGGDGHHRGVPHMLTGTEMLSTSQAGGASVDQKIASVIGTTTRFASLQLAVRIVYGDTNSRCIWSGPGKVVLPEQNPYNAYSRIFADVDTGAAKPKFDLRKSALDYSLAEMAQLRTQLAADDVQRLESYQTSLREIETRLAQLPSEEVCVKPELAGTIDTRAMENYPKVGQLQTDMIVAAMQCDLTRVASLHWGNSNDQCTYPWLGINALGHDLSHGAVSDASAKKVLVYNWYAKQFAYLLGKLEAANMLDSTVVLWVSEFSNSGAHAANDLMWTLMGNVDGYFRSGRVVDCTGRSTNDLHASICNAFGIADRTFGNPAYCSGAIASLKA